jgi:hypothetical protein
MSKMLCVMLALLVTAQTFAEQTPNPVTPSEGGSPLNKAPDGNYIRITVINLSGKRREAVVRKTVVNLPVAEPITLQMHAGERFRVVSDTDSRINSTFLITEKDAGQLITVP